MSDQDRNCPKDGTDWRPFEKDVDPNSSFAMRIDDYLAEPYGDERLNILSDVEISLWTLYSEGGPLSGPDGIVSGLRLVAFDYDLDSSSISFAEWVDAMIKDAFNKAERDDRIKGLELEIGHLQSLLVKWKEKLDEEG